MLSAVPGNIEVVFFLPHIFVSSQFCSVLASKGSRWGMRGSRCFLAGYGIAVLHTTAVASPRSKPELCPGKAGSYVFYDLNCVLEFYGIISSLLYVQYSRHDLVVMVKL